MLLHVPLATTQDSNVLGLYPSGYMIFTIFPNVMWRDSHGLTIVTAILGILIFNVLPRIFIVWTHVQGLCFITIFFLFFLQILKKWNEIAVFIFDCGFYKRRSEFDNDVYVKYHIQTNCWSHCQFEYGEVSKIDAFA